MAERSNPAYERFAQHWDYGDVAWLRARDLLFTANITGQMNLWRQSIGPHGERGFAEPMTAYMNRAVRSIVPVPDGTSLFVTADRDGDEQMQILRIPGDGGDLTPITDDRKVRHEVSTGGVDPSGRRLLYIDNKRTPSRMDVVLVDLLRRTRVRPLPQGALWSSPTWDPLGRRFFTLKVHGNTRVQTFVHDVARKTTVEVLPHEEESWALAEAWTKDGRGLLMRTDMDGEFKQLERVDLGTGQRKVLAAAKGDVEDVRDSPRSSFTA